MDAGLREAPGYAGVDGLRSAFPGIGLLGPTATVCPSPDQLTAAHADRANGRVADYPTMLVNVPSALDPALITAEGDHVLSIEVLFTPYNLLGG